MIKHSIKQMVRKPLISISFLLLLALSALLLTSGTVLWVDSSSTLRRYEAGFTTIGTAEQKAFAMSQRMEWDAELKDYRIFQEAEYSTFLPLPLLSFEGANYIHEPEKRSYYGSYAPEYVLWTTPDSQTSIVIAEISPMEDCVPDESVKVKVNRVLFGSPYLEGAVLWFCDHFTPVPKPMEKEKSYAVYLDENGPTHGEYYEDAKSAGSGTWAWEYVPLKLSAEQYQPDGARMEDILQEKVIEDSPYYEVTAGFYDTDIGKRILNMAAGYSLFFKTMPVTGTNATKLLMSFYRGDTYINEGRDITEDEYAEGKKVCLIPRDLAENNLLTVGDSVRLQLYFTNSREAVIENFSNGGARWGWTPITAKGEAHTVFEDSQYKIVGIYDRSPGAGQDQYSIGQGEVIVPLTSIENRDSCNIVEYGPMQGNTTSFQIPNGSIENFLTAWEQYGTDELEISFYDMGYSQLQAGMENMKRMSLLLLAVGFLMSIFLLLFYSHLFITGQMERTAIERCLGVNRKQCRSSLLSGILILLVSGSFLGSGLGGVLSMRISAESMNRVYYDATYDRIVEMETEETAKMGEGNTAAVILASLAAGSCIILFGTMISLGKINRNLKAEPIKLLAKRRE